MKKIILVFMSLISVLFLASCKTTTSKKYSILIPNGTPMLALTYIDFEKYDVTYVSGSDVITSAFASESYDFIVAPIQMGAKLYNVNKKYSLVSVLVNCNYYLASKSEITLENLGSKSITLFGENTMPDIITKYVFTKNELEGLNVEYVSSAQDSASKLAASLTEVALLSEPQISSLEAKLGSLSLINLSDLFLEGETLDFIPQAALFVRNGVEESAINELKEEAKSSIESVVESPASAASYIQTISVDGLNKMSASILEACISRANLKYTSASDSKESVLSFFNILNGYNSKLIGGDVDEGFFK